MKKSSLVVAVVVILGVLGGCGGDSGSTVAGKASFVQGGSPVTRTPATFRSGHRLDPNHDYIISPNKAKVTFKSVTFTAGASSKGAWATASFSGSSGARIGGWLGKDSTNVLAWALPLADGISYNAYFTMQEQLTVGGSTTLNCKVSASPPAPADGKTYASGAPAMTGPTTYTLNLLAK